MESEQAFLAKSLFLQGSYSACVATVKSDSHPSLASSLYAARSLIAQESTDEAAELLSALEEQDDPAVRAVTLLNEAIAVGDSVADELKEILQEPHVSDLARAVGGLILLNEGEVSEAMGVWYHGVREHDQECVALLVQQYLAMDRLDAAKATYDGAKAWLEDSLVSQLCEAWIGLKTGAQGGEAYQAAFYVFDEVAQMPSANNVVVLQGKAIAQACMGNWPEADAALVEASQLNPTYPHTFANLIAMAIPAGKASQADFLLECGCSSSLARRLFEIQSDRKLKGSGHPMLEDLAHKSALFDEAATKFAPAAAAPA